VAQEGLAEGRGDAPAVGGRRLRRTGREVLVRQGLQRRRFAERRVEGPQTLPAGGDLGGGVGAGRVGLGVADQRYEGMVDQDIDVRDGAPDGGLVEALEPRLPTRLAQHAGMAQAGQRQVMQEGRAKQLGRQVEARLALADDPHAVRRLEQGLAGGLACEIHFAGQAPVVDAGWPTIPHERPVADIQIGGLASQPPGRGGGEQRADLGAGHADRRAGDFRRHGPHGQAFVGDVACRRWDHAHLREREVELIGGHLGERGGDALTVFHPPEGDASATVRLEADPAVKPGIGGEHGGNHAEAPSRMRRAANTTASITRLCTPQRQRCQSSASATSARVGSGLPSSRALAPIRMPDRQ
jgi:hypothetical protein